MRAVIRRDGKLVVDEMAAPTPGPGQLLAKSLVCGICGSDLHMLDHYDHMIDLTTRLGGISQMKKGADTVFGHEFCCEVLESAGAFKAGDVVVSLPVLLERDRRRLDRPFQQHPGRLRRESAAHRGDDAAGAERALARARGAHRAAGGGRARGRHGRSGPRARLHGDRLRAGGPGRHRLAEGPRLGPGDRRRLFARAPRRRRADGRRQDRRSGRGLAARVLGRATACPPPAPRA